MTTGEVKMAYSPNTLKRKNEDCTDLEAEIKRVALDDVEDIDGEAEVTNGEEIQGESQEEEVIEQAEQEIMLRMLCLVKQASLVVGPKGESISRLRDNTLTRVNVSANLRGVPERVIYVKGNCENVAKAFGEISRTLSKAEEPNLAVSDDSISQDEKERVETTPLTLNLLISHSLMGSVIGKSGSQLREIEELSAAKLFASPNQLMMSNDRILNITGVPDAIHIATYYVSQSLLNCRKELKARKAIHYQPSQGYSALPNNFSNVPYNKNFSHQTHHQYHPMDKYNVYRYNKPLRFPRNQNNMPKRVSIEGPFVMNDAAGYKGLHMDNVPVLYTPANVANATSFTPTAMIPNVRIVESSEQATRYNAPISLVKQEIYIDENFVGNIIGKEGKHINSVKESTGCTIFIDNKVEGSSERKLVIRGTYMASQAAIMLISNKIEMDRASTERNFNN